MITTVNSARLIKLLEAEGWVSRRVRGSHHVYTHPERGGHLTIPHTRKDLGTGLAHKILKQAGIDTPRGKP